MNADDIDVGPKVKRVANGGSVARGEDVFFEFETFDGALIPMHAPLGVMPQIFSALYAFAQMAQNDRRGRPGGTSLDEIVQPWRATDVTFGWRHDGEAVVLRFPTVEGVPMMIAMDPALLEKLRSVLDRALVTRPQTPRPLN